MLLLLILRTAVYLEVGLTLTFWQSHSWAVGLTAIASFGIGYALVGVLVAIIQAKKLSAYQTLPLTGLALIVGLLALAAPQDNSADSGVWVRYLVVAWGLGSGLFELFLARRTGIKSLRGKETLLSAVLSLILGFLFLIAKLPALDSVGFLGAYMIINAVHLGIAAASFSGAKPKN